MHQDGAKRPTNLPMPRQGGFSKRMWPTGNERGFLMTTRRQFLIGISAALVAHQRLSGPKVSCRFAASSCRFTRTIMVGAIALRLIFIITVENYEAQP